jgi:hypothetical protein
MRFQQHIKESNGNTPFIEIIDLIYDKCRPFLKDISKSGKLDGLLFSGRKSYKDYFIRALRTDRRPSDTKQNVHEYFDKEFNKKFGFKARSNAIFCTGRPSIARSYGNLYCIFPIGKYNFVWSDDIKDLFMAYDKHLSNNHQKYKWNGDYHVAQWEQDAKEEWEDDYGEGKQGFWDYEDHNINMYSISTTDRALKSREGAMKFVKKCLQDTIDGKTPKHKIHGIDNLNDDEIKTILNRVDKKNLTWYPLMDSDIFIDGYVSDKQKEFLSKDNEEWVYDLLDDWFPDILKTYSNKDIVRAINSENEIMVNCKEYIAVSYDIYGEALTDYINKYGDATPDEKKIKDWYMRVYGRLPKQLTLF